VVLIGLPRLIGSTGRVDLTGWYVVTGGGGEARGDIDGSDDVSGIGCVAVGPE
jgi:hypothetical protein